MSLEHKAIHHIINLKKPCGGKTKIPHHKEKNKGDFKPMQKLKDRKPLLIKILAVILLVLLCCTLPQELLFWKLCLEQDHDIPPNTEVLVSACKSPVATGVPGGEVLFVREGRTEKIYLLDLRTGEKRDVPNDPLLLDKGIFLSSELVWLEGSLVGPGEIGYRPHYILDLTDGQRYELLDLGLLPHLESGKFDPKYFAYFQSAEQVFIDHTENRLIALAPDFHQHHRGVIFSGSSLGRVTINTSGDLLEQLMKDLGVEYEIVDFSLKYADIPSPTGRYTVRNDGIYFSGTNLPVEIHDIGPHFRGWYYDESGVVLQRPWYFLISGSLTGSSFPNPRPVLKLHLHEP